MATLICHGKTYTTDNKIEFTIHKVEVSEEFVNASKYLSELKGNAKHKVSIDIPANIADYTLNNLLNCFIAIPHDCTIKNIKENCVPENICKMLNDLQFNHLIEMMNTSAELQLDILSHLIAKYLVVNRALFCSEKNVRSMTQITNDLK